MKQGDHTLQSNVSRSVFQFYESRLPSDESPSLQTPLWKQTPTGRFSPMHQRSPISVPPSFLGREQRRRGALQTRHIRRIRDTSATPPLHPPPPAQPSVASSRESYGQLTPSASEATNNVSLGQRCSQEDTMSHDLESARGCRAYIFRHVPLGWFHHWSHNKTSPPQKATGIAV